MKTKSIKTAGYSSDTLYAKREDKRQAAGRRNAAWAALTTEQKIESLRMRRGDSARQLLRLRGK